MRSTVGDGGREEEEGGWELDEREGGRLRTSLYNAAKPARKAS